MSRTLPLKTSLEVARMRPACRAAREVLCAVGRGIKPGVRTQELDEIGMEAIRRLGGEPALLGYRGYRKALCTSINNVAAHGVPGEHVVQAGDIVTIDVTVKLDGWHGDAAWTFVAGEGAYGAAHGDRATNDGASADGTGDARDRQTERRLLRAAWRACTEGIRAAEAGARLGDVGQAAKDAAKRFGCSIVPRLVGHGIGRHMHEEPQVVYDGPPGTGRPIVPGMVFTVEPVVTLGDGHTRTLNDGWSEVTTDGTACAQFEHTIAVFSDRTEVLTGNPAFDLLSLDFPSGIE